MLYQIHGGRMTNHQVAKELMMQYEDHSCFGLFRGVSPFKFMYKLGIFIPYKDDLSNIFCVTMLRIFDYWHPAVEEVGWLAADDGNVVNPEKGKTCRPLEVLSTKVAPSGWEIHGLKVGYGNIVRKWLEEHPDS